MLENVFKRTEEKEITLFRKTKKIADELKNHIEQYYVQKDVGKSVLGNTHEISWIYFNEGILEIDIHKDKVILSFNESNDDEEIDKTKHTITQNWKKNKKVIQAIKETMKRWKVEIR